MSTDAKSNQDKPWIDNPIEFMSKFNPTNLDLEMVTELQSKSIADLSRTIEDLSVAVGILSVNDAGYINEHVIHQIDLCKYAIASKLDDRVHIEISTRFITGEINRALRNQETDLDGWSKGVARKFYEYGFKNAVLEVEKRINAKLSACEIKKGQKFSICVR